MTFPNRNQAGSGAYARSLVAAVKARADVQTEVVSAPAGTNFAGTLTWLVRGAGNRLRKNPASLLHCPNFVTPWNLPIPFVPTVLDLATRRFPGDYPLEWRGVGRWRGAQPRRPSALAFATPGGRRRGCVLGYRVL